MNTPTDISTPTKISSLRARRRQLHEATIEPTPAAVIERSVPTKPPVVTAQVQLRSRAKAPMPAGPAGGVFHDIAPTTLRASTPAAQTAQAAPAVQTIPVAQNIQVAMPEPVPVTIPVADPVPIPAQSPDPAELKPSMARDQVRAMPVSARVVSVNGRGAPAPAAPVSTAQPAPMPVLQINDIAPAKNLSTASSTYSVGVSTKPQVAPTALPSPSQALPRQSAQLVSDMVRPRPVANPRPRVADQWPTAAFQQVLDQQQTDREQAAEAEYMAANPRHVPKRKRKGFALAFAVAAFVMFGLGVGISGAVVHHNAEAQTSNVLQSSK